MFDRRPQPPRDGCGDNGSVRGVYEADGGLGHVKIGTISTNLDFIMGGPNFKRANSKFLSRFADTFPLFSLHVSLYVILN